MKKSLMIVLSMILLMLMGCQKQDAKIENDLTGVYVTMDEINLVEFTEDMAYRESGEVIRTYRIEEAGTVTVEIEGEVATYSYQLAEHFLRMSADGQGEKLLWMKDYFEGEIREWGEGQLTVVLEKPSKDQVIFTIDEAIVFDAGVNLSDLTIGSKVLLKTDGTTTLSMEPQMPVIRILKAFDHQTDRDVMEKYFLEKGVQELVGINDKFTVKENHLFAIEFDMPVENERWKLTASARKGIDYLMHSESVWTFQANSIGEYFMTFEKVDKVTGEVLETRNLQIFVENLFTTQGNIFEVQGVITELDERVLDIDSDDGHYAVYVPAEINMEDFELDRPMIFGIEVGEAAYLLRFIANDQLVIDEGSGLEIIRHIGLIERLDGERVQLLINEYVLEIYHNGLADSGYEMGDCVYVEYVADHNSESNELIFMQKVE